MPNNPLLRRYHEAKRRPLRTITTIRIHKGTLTQ